MAREVRNGETITSNGVTFTFSETVPLLVKSTTSESGGFAWRWLAGGEVVEMTGNGVTKRDGALLIGDDQGWFHALTLPLRDDHYLYECVAVSSVEIEPVTKKGLFGGTKVRGASVILNDHLAFVAFQVDEFTGGRPDRVQGRREAEFFRHYGVTS